jgi:hypothetical protein
MGEYHMALTNCRECQAQVSTEAFACPHCGAPVQPTLRVPSRGFEWKSATTILGYPLVHVALGRNSEGKLRVAKGIIAIGQFGVGLITIAQFGVGLLFGFGQFMAGLLVLAQFAGGLVVGVGQFATGYVAFGQVVLGYYSRGQVDLGKFLWRFIQENPELAEFLRSIWGSLKNLTGKF